MTGSLLEGVRVMLVEDDALIGLDLQDRLETLGACVFGPLPRVSLALQTLAGADRIDCAVLDISLGSELVFPVADKLRERGIPFVFVTAYSRLMLPDEYQCVPCCGKPADARHVATALAEVMQHQERNERDAPED